MIRPLLSSLLLWTCSSSALQSRPYVPYRTSPYDQPSVHHNLTLDGGGIQRSTVRRYSQKTLSDSTQCPLQFTLGLSQKSHTSHNKQSLGIVQPPILYPIFPSRGPGRQIVHLTRYEHLDLLTPSFKEGLVQEPDFPLLFESSSFAYTSPLLHDVNGDGVMEAIVLDYDGGLYMKSLSLSNAFFHKTQIPRLYLRRDWMTHRLNETMHAEPPENKEDDPYDPYHAHFEYLYNHDHKVLQGVSANVLQQPHDHAEQLSQRRQQRVDPLEKLQHALEQEGEERHEVDEPQGHDVDSTKKKEEAAKETKTEEEQTPKLQQEAHRRLQQQAENAPKDEEKTAEQKDATKQQEPRKTGAAENNNKPQENVNAAAKKQDSAAAADKNNIKPNENANQQRQDSAATSDKPKENANQQRQASAATADKSKENANQQRQAQDSAATADKPDQKANENEQQQQQQKAQAADKPKENKNQQRQAQDSAATADKPKENANQQRQDSAATADKPKETANENKQQRQAQDSATKADKPDEKANENKQQQKIEAAADKPVENTNEKKQEEATTDEQKKDPLQEDFKPFDSRDASRDSLSDRAREFDDDYPSDEEDWREDREYMDDMEPRPGEDDYAYGYDDYYYNRHNEAYDEYYDDKHYVRIPPHVLCNPVLAEMPKQYGNVDEMEDMLFVAVSYYLDEDEYEGFFSYKRFDNVDRGDETEVQRGMYVSSAIMVYSLGEYMRWGRQEQLDLSGDATAPQNATLVGAYPIVSHDTKMGAFALGAPTVADIDGDGQYEVLLGTSMGLVYALDARNIYNRDGWPVQMKNPVESRILVEDVVGDTDLEVFVADAGGNIVCLNKQGQLIWNRDLVKSIDEGAELLGSSEMSLGDVDGDGRLDLVVVLKLDLKNQQEMSYVVAISAVDGRDLKNFPIAIESDTKTDDADKTVRQKLPQPLLVDLHADQSQWRSLFNRSSASADLTKEQQVAPPKPPHGGIANGLHIVQPIGSDLFIIEAGSGCIQKIAIGDEVATMVQADDVHGTDRLDLVISTASGNIVTLESPAVPYHPLNVWNNGEMRGRRNTFAQGYGASQGIFVHSVSRRYRDIFGVYVPVTFEIFDKRPSIATDPSKRVYKVEFRDGTSSKRALFRKEYNTTGVFTERFYIPYGPGYYTITATLRTTHGLIYEDAFHVGYNVHFMDGFGLLLWLPLVLAAIPIVFCGRKKVNWDDEDFDDGVRGERGLGILGRALPTTA